MRTWQSLQCREMRWPCDSEGVSVNRTACARAASGDGQLAAAVLADELVRKTAV